MVHPIFEPLLEPFSGSKTPNDNYHITEPARTEPPPAAISRNLNTLMNGVEAHDAWLLTQQEMEDEAWNAACEAAEYAMSFDDLIDARVDLPEADKATALACLADGRDTDVLHKIYENVKRAKVEEILKKAKWRLDHGQDWDDFGGDAA